uniref:Uncharacterized protein n=1 Tax=Rhizophora mucronata TaxID=61149 RepID=A0A2P2R2W5_RHIMU
MVPFSFSFVFVVDGFKMSQKVPLRSNGSFLKMLQLLILFQKFELRLCVSCFT